MGASNVATLLVYSFGMALGQVLFKLAADRAASADAPQFLASLLTSWQFYFALAIYGALTILWVWILTRMPLSHAYPFVVLAFVLTPAFGVLFFREAVGGWYLVSLGLILAGLGLLVLKGGVIGVAR